MVTTEIGSFKSGKKVGNPTEIGRLFLLVFSTKILGKMHFIQQPIESKIKDDLCCIGDERKRVFTESGACVKQC